MTLLVLLVIAVAAGCVGYNAASKFETQHRKRLLGISALVWGIGCSFIALIGAFLVTALVLGALVGFVAYNETARFERQYRERPAGISAWTWGIGCGAFAAAGTLVTSALFWGLLCVFLGLSGALFLVIDERNMLRDEMTARIAENGRLISENDRLTAERNPTRNDAESRRSPASFDTGAAGSQPQRQWAPPPRQWGSGPAQPDTAQPTTRQARGFGGNDLLPRR